MGDEEYAGVVDRLVRGLTVEPALLLDPLADRMAALAAARRYEEAAEVRDRAAALSRALTRQRRMDALRAAGRIVVELPGTGGGAAIVDGRLVDAWSGARPPDGGLSCGGTDWGAVAAAMGPPDASGGWPAPVARDHADEVLAVAAWLDANVDRIRLVECTHGLSLPAGALPAFTPARDAGDAHGRAAA